MNSDVDPHSLTTLWAVSWQSTDPHGGHSAESPRALAAVPDTTGNTATSSWSNTSATRRCRRAVHGRRRRPSLRPRRRRRPRRGSRAPRPPSCRCAVRFVGAPGRSRTVTLEAWPASDCAGMRRRARGGQAAGGRWPASSRGGPTAEALVVERARAAEVVGRGSDVALNVDPFHGCGPHRLGELPLDPDDRRRRNLGDGGERS